MSEHIFATAMATFEGYSKYCMNRDYQSAPHYLMGKYEVLAAAAVAKLHAYDPEEANRLLNAITVEEYHG